MIKSLDELTLWQRIALLVIIILIILLAILFLGQESGVAQGPLPAKERLPPKGTFVGRASPWDGRMLAIDREALDEAYKNQIMHLFMIWMKDDQGQPERAIKGAQQARRAYILVMTGLDERQKALEHAPLPTEMEHR